MLASFHLASNNPLNLLNLMKNIENTAAAPESIEILVKVDQEDHAMIRFLSREKQKWKVNFKHIITPRLEGYSSLWLAYNELLPLCDDDVYFVSLITDEFRFLEYGWDTKLRKYIDFFPDGIFRLRISQFKLHNYFNYWECGYAPDSYAFHTKKWFDVSGDWNACNTPDAFQQLVMFYLYKSTLPSPRNVQHSRDIPIWDIKISGETPYLGLSEEQLKERVRRAKIDWRIFISPAIK